MLTDLTQTASHAALPSSKAPGGTTARPPHRRHTLLAQGLALIITFSLVSFTQAETVSSLVPDPLRPPGMLLPHNASPVDTFATPDNASPLVLQATRIDPHQRQAVINGTTYRLGDSVGPARITAISAAEVRLQHEDDEIDEIVLQFPHTGLNKRPTGTSR